MNTRTQQLHQLARAYVLDGLGKRNFNVIPYAENVILRAPLCPGIATVSAARPAASPLQAIAVGG